MANLRRPLGDCPREQDLQVPRLATQAPAPQPSGPLEMTVECQRPTFRAVDEPVDRLMADARIIIADELQPAGDLLGRPAALKFLDDVLA
jgi:hypothetical protein